ncbi:hypothetical protein JCM10914A_33490 [Paenibacillus sp. JCM 10914]|uniref:Spo0B domain-containing protein n=1 Tax=Paenibacillus sp. JCM 10914 TaxID=1236974 RepID=UPI0003CC2632|nr:Spo0B domain-containing protein [Paenibacillus sp. JCM 10914]GAE07627.1 hypothetical protein JCM10914_3865 [Paenibacillus sp. JCM 10914]
MKSWKWIAAGAGLTSVIPVAWMVWKPTWIAGAVLILWSVAASVCGAWLVQRSAKNRQQVVIQELEQTAIQTLNHHRHDWMNELQILYGYIQLGKLDKSVACVERIKEQMATESRISKLGIPSLVFYLHSYRTLGTNLQLEVEIVDQVQLEQKVTPSAAESFTDAIIQMVRAFQLSGEATWGEARQLTLTLMEQEQELIVWVQGDGAFGDPDQLKLQIEQSIQGEGIRVEQTEPGETSYRVYLPFVT